MNCHELLLSLTKVNEDAENLDEKLQQILDNVQTQASHLQIPLPEDVSGNLDEEYDARLQYLRTIAHVLKKTQESDANDDGLMSVQQFQTIKVAIELITSIGIIPCLLPAVAAGMTKLCPRASRFCQEKIGDLQKYKRLTFSAGVLTECYKEPVFRPAILSHLGPLLAALLQLHHAPLMKPSEDPSSSGIDDKTRNQFIMTVDLYNSLKKDQERFGDMLNSLLDNCPQTMVMKELMIILGMKRSPPWLRRNIQEYLVQKIMQSNGVVSIIAAVCDDTLDLGEHWDKLDTVARLIATPQGRIPVDYYKAVCPQILDILASKEIKHAATIANCCISAIYECDPNICVTRIVNVITEPLLIQETCGSNYLRTEDEVERCIENLTRCFITVEAKFKHLPCKLMSNVAIPLFSLYNDIRQSPCALKGKLKQLLLRLLYERELREKLFSAFLGHEANDCFGSYIASRFGPSGGVEIIGVSQNLDYEEFSDTQMELLADNGALSSDLFAYLLKFLSNSLKLECNNSRKDLLETEEDMMERMQKQLAAIKLLSNLANTSVVQEEQIKKPEGLFSFIKSLFNQYTSKHETEVSEDDCEILYVSLMLVKMILSEKRPQNWEPFNDFCNFIKKYCDVPNIPTQLSILIHEVVKFIETQGRTEKHNYQDLSVDRKTSNKFEEALKDLGDPLLPVRAHGLISLTKLIEIKDPCAVARKAIILRLFEENLKHEDSFIYLAAINGFCALASSYPDVVLQTLVQEFIDMPQRVTSGTITSETRMKLGEILVKTTRALGEMAAPHKNLLVNGFLCAVRDSDPLVRASSLSCLGELCKVLGFRLGNIVIEVIYCITCIVKTDKVPECRRAAVLVATLLLRGLGKDTLTSLGKDLVDLYRGLKHLRDNDDDPVIRLHAQLALEELDLIVRDFLFTKPRLEKRIFLLDPIP